MRILAEKTGLIYKISFTNGKVYIGQTSRSVFSRGAEHLRQSSGCIKLKNAFNKYGHDDCTMEILKDNIPVEYLDFFENKYIDQYDSIKNGYNIKYNHVKKIPLEQDLEPYVPVAPKVNIFAQFANKDYTPKKKKIECLLPKTPRKKEDKRPWLRMPSK
ncbi:hypothetical protein MT325_M180L [Paramecium bursaria chlorella virus MT325]|uniref:Uncharacterized protein M180L n=1 Tax=Paramecium bursaria Chlorella virus MT325 TaxID=346932 RepID=A7ITR0_PBCVM|nr:hypothetical protein MT325_M180L [Paramecium bursaria chlorella virus MT325]